MIQDIAPHNYIVSYSERKAQLNDTILIYQKEQILLNYQNEILNFPTLQNLLTIKPEINNHLTFLFQVDNCSYYSLTGTSVPSLNGFTYEPINLLRNALPAWKSFSAITGYQIYKWMNHNAYCSICGTKMQPKKDERAMECLNCSHTSYPLIMPSVIVGVTNGDYLLLTKYTATHSSYRNYALIAGYVEIGETLEDTVIREVEEEVGLHVKNIHYYKSQPWAFTDTLLVGFFCEVDGESSITLEEDELSEAKWFHKSEIPQLQSTASLTNNMIEYFRNHS